MIIIYSPHLTARLSYILYFFWEEDYIVTNNWEEFLQAPLPKINYSSRIEASSALFIPSINLLFENEIDTKTINVAIWKTLPIFFQTDGDIPFDIFAASFYLISRYEEYLPHDKDKCGRYAEWNSMAFKNNFLNIPIVDYWFDLLENILKEKFPNYEKRTRTFQYTPTFDIDVPYAYLHKNLLIHIGGTIKNIINGQFPELKARINILLKKQPDPYDNFDLLESSMKKYGFDPIFFFPVAKNHGQYDKNPPQTNKTFQYLIQEIASQSVVAWHPSWQSCDSIDTFQQEKSFLEQQTKNNITKSRQHYIRMTLPETYHKLISFGIRDDYSMGYGEVNGFRAGTSRTFLWFDLIHNKTTELKVHPFCWMDATNYHNKGKVPKKTLQDLKYYYDVIKRINGEMITIMHNNYFAPTPEMHSFRNAMLTFWEYIDTQKE